MAENMNNNQGTDKKPDKNSNHVLIQTGFLQSLQFLSFFFSFSMEEKLYRKQLQARLRR